MASWTHGIAFVAVAFVGMTVAGLACGCTHADPKLACANGRVEVAVGGAGADDVSGSSARDPFESATRVAVRGLDGVGCETLQGPLVAVNAFIPPTDAKDLEALETYNSGVVPFLLGSGSKLLFAAETKSRFVQEPGPPLAADVALLLPMYRSAAAFVSMVSDPDFRPVFKHKASVVYASYSFVFQKCLAGCEQLLPLPPGTSTPAVVVHFAIDADAAGLAAKDRARFEQRMVEAMAGLRVEAQFEVAYAGVAVARPEIATKDGADQFPYPAHGLDATLVLIAASGVEPDDLLKSKAFQALRAEAHASGVLALSDDEA